MATPCPGCNKMASLELQDPEENSLDLRDDRETAEESATIEFDVRIVRNSECCGEEMKEYTFNGSVDFTSAAHFEEGHELELDASLDPYEEGGGRYKKSYFGFSGEFTLICSCGEPVNDISIESSDECETAEAGEGVINITCKIAASSMDDLN